MPEMAPAGEGITRSVQTPSSASRSCVAWAVVAVGKLEHQLAQPHQAWYLPLRGAVGEARAAESAPKV